MPASTRVYDMKVGKGKRLDIVRLLYCNIYNTFQGASTETDRQLTQRRAQILDQIAGLGPMRMGSIAEQHLPTRRKDGSVYRRGPHLTYTFKQGGRTRGKHLRNAQEAALYRRQIEAFRRRQTLSAELVQVSQRLANLEAAGKEEGQKNSRN
ncbi:MAG: hypothetical protein NTW86_08695 [Candidatus Sumerlaeota bacterium]|nr:hypothetical protein [Candidatus Sumerlaeota bacterium]